MVKYINHHESSVAGSLMENSLSQGLGTRTELMKDPHWGGLPPVGENPIHNKIQFMVELILLMLLEIALWSVYRYLSAPILGDAFSYTFFIFHIIFAPLIHLTPIYLYWRFRLKEYGLPFLITRKNLFTAVLTALVSVILLYVLFQYLLVFFCVLMGIIIDDSFIFAEWLTSEPGWFVLMMFTFFFVVGPVEELQHRGFLQDQINRVNKPFVGIIVSAFFFGLGHLPIYFILYNLSPIVAAITMMYTITFGILMSLFYHWSRNIVGPIILHGFWDWQLSVYTIVFVFANPMPGDSVIMSALMWLSAIISMTVVTFILYLAYRLWWKGDRPDGSLGFRIPGLAAIFRPDGFLARNGRAIKDIRFMKTARHYDTYDSPQNKSIIITGMVILIFCGVIITWPMIKVKWIKI
jgi:membrane protease YdiL (CAAX protease family)